MKTIYKKIIYSLLCASFAFMGILPAITLADAPLYETHFQNKLTSDEGVYDAKKEFRISADKSIRENIEILFSPYNNQSMLWDFIKQIIIGVTILFVARAGIDFLTNPNKPDKLKSARMSLLYILVGWFLIYAAVRIISTLFAINGVNPATDLTQNITQRIFFTVLTFLRAGAFFLAIVMAVFYGYQMISAMDKDERALKARKWIMNVLIALIFMKVIDFVFFIAQDHAFGSRIQELLLSGAKILGRVMGAVMVLVLIYGWFRYISAQGDENKAKDAQKMITRIFYAVLIVFMFLLVTRQIIDAFAK